MFFVCGTYPPLLCVRDFDRPLVKALPSVDGAEPCLVVSWDELKLILKKAKKGQYGCWELYGDGCASPSKARMLKSPALAWPPDSQ